MKDKESKLYIRFFWNNLPLILAAALFFSTAGYFISQRFPVYHHANVLYQVNGGEMGDKVTMADQAVAHLRSKNIQLAISLAGYSRLKVYKSGPYLINLDLANTNTNLVKEDLVKAENYLTGSFPVSRIGGEVSYRSQPPVLLWILAGGVVGILLGMVISAARQYLREF